MIKYLFKLVIFTVLVYLCLSDDKIAEVVIKQGVVLGKIENTVFKKQDYYSFKGIPYAAPPVGELRFQPPVSHQGWIDKLEAFENKPTCVQFSSRMRNYEPFGISGSEDCLYISVFTPNTQGTAPVVVFDYNDSFQTGFNGTDTYSPDHFIEEGVVVVTIGHRLGLLGYLTTEDEVIKGNNGLRDFIFGLEWIRSNINSFGGDPNRVTLMGSCGSAALVNMLLYSQKAKGLFSGVIMQSGNAFHPAYFYQGIREQAFLLGEQFNITTNDSSKLLQVLQKPTPEELLNKFIDVLSADFFSKENQKDSPLFAPIVENNYSDAVLTALPEDSEIVNDVPVIIGFNSREGLDYIAQLLISPMIVSAGFEDNLLQFPIRTGYQFERKSKIFKEAVQEILEFYIESNNIAYDTLLEYAVFAGDVGQGYSLNYAAKKLSSTLKSSVFYYMFDFRGQLNENSQCMTRKARSILDHWGATVTDELCYLFVCSRIKIDYVNMSKMASEQKEHKVLKKMVRMWTNFINTGNPTPNKDALLNNFVWEPTIKNAEHLEYLHITKDLKMDDNPLRERIVFWDKFLAKYGEMAVNGIVKDQEESRDEL